MVTTARKTLLMLTRREHWRLGGLLGLILITALLQVVSVGAIVPLMNLLVEPDSISDNSVLSWVSDTFSIDSPRRVLVVMVSIVFAVIIISNLLSALTIWAMTRFAWATQHRVSARLLEVYLHQPYVYFLDHNSADISKNVLIEVQLFTNGVLLPLLRMAAFGMVVIFITGFLLWFDILLAGIAVLVVGGGYIAIYLVVRRGLGAAGIRRAEANTLRFKAVQEALGLVRDVKVLGAEDAFVDSYKAPARKFAGATATVQIVSQLPRFAVEALAIGSVLVVVLIVAGINGDFEDVIPAVSVFTFAGFRMIPAVQGVYESWSRLRFNRVVVDTVYNDLAMGDGEPLAEPGKVAARMPLQHSIELKDVGFTYPNAGGPSLHNISISIPKGATVALVGETGSGKTTLAGILLGLLTPQSGQLLVDGEAVQSANMRDWQNNLGYVAQDIFLTDDSIAANIALGIPASDRDVEAIQQAARIANIHEFITGELPDSYESIVGERGVRLSGGERQRIGIARALYKNPEVLVLDEATSNLDMTTEAAVHLAIQQATKSKTVIMIAHRLVTTSQCDVLYLLDHGLVTHTGTYDELIGTDGKIRPSFLSG